MHQDPLPDPGSAGDEALCVEQVTQPDPRVLALLEELARGPMPDWDPPPALLVLNKARHSCIASSK